MLVQQTIDKLRQMKLTGMMEAYLTQQQQPDLSSLSFDERFGLMVDHEATYRDDRRLARLMKESKLRYPACLEDIDYHHSRGLDRSVMRSLSSCRWIRSHQNILICGPTGVGKTYIACAFGNAACRQGLRTRYYRVPRLLDEVFIARADGSYPKWLAQFAKIDLLVLDDWGLAPLSPNESRELLEIIEDRYASKSTIVTSQLPIKHWHEVLGDPTVADAILDRLVHGSHKLLLDGGTMRKIPVTNNGDDPVPVE